MFSSVRNIENETWWNAGSHTAVVSIPAQIWIICKMIQPAASCLSLWETCISAIWLAFNLCIIQQYHEIVRGIANEDVDFDAFDDDIRNFRWVICFIAVQLCRSFIDYCINNVQRPKQRLIIMSSSDLNSHKKTSSHKSAINRDVNDILVSRCRVDIECDGSFHYTESRSVFDTI
jgi:hypothetical protein